MSVFKAYDVRGIYGDQIDETLARKIGAHFVRLIEAKTIVVGRDMRPCAPSIAAAFIEGATSQGCDVIDIGLASTPMTYFARVFAWASLRPSRTSSTPLLISSNLCRLTSRRRRTVPNCGANSRGLLALNPHVPLRQFRTLAL